MWNFNKYSNNIAVITEDDQKITYYQLGRMQSEFTSLLGTGRELLMLQCSNSLAALVVYLGCICNKKPVMLLDENIRLDRLLLLAEAYRPAWLYLKKGMLQEESAGDYVEVYQDADYILYRRSKSTIDTSYPIHPQLTLLLSTSGSTGSGKQVRISYENLRSNTCAIVEALRIDESSRAIISLPMSYTYGLSVMNTHLFAGGTILLTKEGIYRKRFWDFYRRNHGNSFAGVPYMYQVLKKMNLTKYLFPGTRQMTQAGGKLDEELQHYFGEIAIENGCDFYIMYGQTEATARMTVLSAEDVLRKPGSVGKAIPDGKVLVWNDEDGCPCEPNETGLILYEGANVSMGYAEGWECLARGGMNGRRLLTGDYGYIDEDGYLYLTGRKDRNVKILGKRVSLEEVEQILQEWFGTKISCNLKDKLEISGVADKEEVETFISELLHISRECVRMVEEQKETDEKKY